MSLRRMSRLIIATKFPTKDPSDSIQAQSCLGAEIIFNQAVSPSHSCVRDDLLARRRDERVHLFSCCVLETFSDE